MSTLYLWATRTRRIERIDDYSGGVDEGEQPGQILGDATELLARCQVIVPEVKCGYVSKVSTISSNEGRYVLSRMRIIGTALRPVDLDRSCRRLELTAHRICSQVRNKAAASKMTAKTRAAIMAASLLVSARCM